MSIDEVKVVGVGWGKTGTSSLGKALKILGFDRHVSYSPELVMMLKKGRVDDVLARLENFNAMEDWPFPLMYQSIDQHFPNAKFVLTERDPEKRMTSYQGHVQREDSAAKRNSLLGIGPRIKEQIKAYRLRRIRKYIYGFKEPDLHPEEMIALYKKHNMEVRNYFKDRPQKLLIVNWENGDGWNELCGFLELSEPAEEFPHLKDRRKFSS
ncbi:hypothetical protein E4634_17395 [Mangrovimicrobium sediminis]|uniref:Sulfotransferase family protein n=1 Tax=Mangrovimicrobium sediminis TaxID=2562682 RepID=A0A4Z0LXS6_9GAMM|nr:sulfotransferase family protein [Haliea sp. SAOS-164]TGD71885.1 hypothetical protein E4634_17395 [Haliea sp. SAOS-164]